MELLLGKLVRQFLFLELFTKPVDPSTKCDALGFGFSICAIAAWRSRCLQMVGLALISSTASACFLGALNGKITLYCQAVHNLFCFTSPPPSQHAQLQGRVLFSIDFEDSPPHVRSCCLPQRLPIRASPQPIPQHLILLRRHPTRSRHLSTALAPHSRSSVAAPACPLRTFAIAQRDQCSLLAAGGLDHADTFPAFAHRNDLSCRVYQGRVRDRAMFGADIVEMMDARSLASSSTTPSPALDASPGTYVCARGRDVRPHLEWGFSLQRSCVSHLRA